jgi:hypothetical protein
MKRIPLQVEAVFLPDGRVLPRRIFVREIPYEINKIRRIRPYCPPLSGGLAPLEYTVLIHGIEKRLYYETDRNLWFSMKETTPNLYESCVFQPCDPAQ